MANTSRGDASTSADPRAQIVRIGDYTLAVHGHTLTRYGADFHPLGDLPDIVAVAAQGPHVYAASTQGFLVEITPELTHVRDVAEIGGLATWLAVYGDRVLCAYDDAEGFHLGVFDREGAKRVIEFPKLDFPGEPAQWLLEGDKLYYGVDSGEWGGTVGVVDLRTGKIASHVTDDGVRGLIRIDGRRYAFGGTTHIVMREGVIFELADDSTPRQVWHSTDDVEPFLPIVELRADGAGIRAVTREAVYSVDRAFHAWHRLAMLPAETAMLVMPDATVFATHTDVLVLRGTTVERH